MSSRVPVHKADMTPLKKLPLRESSWVRRPTLIR